MVQVCGAQAWRNPFATTKYNTEKARPVTGITNKANCLPAGHEAFRKGNQRFVFTDSFVEWYRNVNNDMPKSITNEFGFPAWYVELQRRAIGEILLFEKVRGASTTATLYEYYGGSPTGTTYS